MAKLIKLIPLLIIRLISKINTILEHVIQAFPGPISYALIMYKKAIGRGMMLYTSLYIFTDYTFKFLGTLSKGNNVDPYLFSFVEGLSQRFTLIWIIAIIAAPMREWLFDVHAKNK